jgi:DNA-binding Lrp family transcriptional regulator
MKKEIISLLKKHKNLSSSQLSKLIGLSRTRCNEYLKELEREEIAENITVGRKKIYRLRNLG